MRVGRGEGLAAHGFFFGGEPGIVEDVLCFAVSIS